jgi:hypothetical protein
MHWRLAGMTNAQRTPQTPGTSKSATKETIRRTTTTTLQVQQVRSCCRPSNQKKNYSPTFDCILFSVNSNYKTMGNVFGKDKPLKEVLRENKRMINRAVRELDREKTTLEREEKRLTMEIKKAAKEQQMQSVKIMAKVSFISNLTLV